MKGPLLAAIAVFCGSAAAAGPPKDLSHWNGIWNQGDTLVREGIGKPGPLKPESHKLLAQVIADQVPLDPRRWCGGPGFNGDIGGLVDNVEIVAGARHLTVVSELGLVRRIFTDGRPIPPGWPDTREGLSIGHWEPDGTLVVETTHLSPQVSYGLIGSGVVTLGRDVRITERMRLVDGNRLQVETTLFAPQLLTAPEQRTRTFVRVPDTYVPRQWDTCWEQDRAIDPSTGKQRFDLTPPANLPPPPPPPAMTPTTR